MTIPFVNSGKNMTPAGSTSDTVVVTIPATVANNELVVEVSIGADPGAITSVLSVAATGAEFNFLKGETRTNGTRTVRQETWRAVNIAASIVAVTVKTVVAAVFGVEVAQYSGALSLGKIVTGGGTAAPVTLDLVTQDNDNRVVAGFGAENFAGPQFTGADIGNARELQYVLGPGAVDVPAGLLDNTAATPTTVTNKVTTTSQDLWAGVAIELRNKAGGSRSFASLWFGVEAAVPVAVTGGFRSFASMWFGPDGMVPVAPTVSGGPRVFRRASFSPRIFRKKNG